MELTGLRFGHRTEAELDRILADARTTEPTYDHVGSTLRPGVPDGITNREFDVEVDGDLLSAREALGRWVTHAGIGATIHPPDAPIEQGGTILVVISAGPLQLAVPDRLVAVVDEPGRYGFVYGTLPGHQERGEELFLAEEVAPGRLRLSIRVHARADRTLARLGGPFVTRFQVSAARGYLRAWADAIT